jgi:hypothetical protein
VVFGVIKMATKSVQELPKDSLLSTIGRNEEEEEMAMDLDLEQGASPPSGDISETGVEKLTLTSTAEHHVKTIYTGKDTTVEDGECSSLSETDGTDGMGELLMDRELLK